MTLKYLATTAAAVAVVGAAAAGVTSIASSALVAQPQVQPVVFGAPMPLNPASGQPSADQLSGILYGLADPGVPFGSKSGLVEGGIGLIEGATADRMLASYSKQGYLPFSFQVSNVAPAGPGAATATVVASSPQLSPRTEDVTFVDQGGWKLSRASATRVLTSLLG